MNGIGGGPTECSGVGAMILATMSDPTTGKEYIIIDPKAYYMKSAMKFRVFAAQRMRDLRITFTQD
jgi:hypothetical protein